MNGASADPSANTNNVPTRSIMMMIGSNQNFFRNIDASQLGQSEGFDVTEEQLGWLDHRAMRHLVFPEIIFNEGTAGFRRYG